jgi:hypothetical protein
MAVNERDPGVQTWMRGRNIDVVKVRGGHLFNGVKVSVKEARPREVFICPSKLVFGNSGR